MESFHLSLNQVNFEHYQLGEETAGEELHSFSNLVSYDTDFVEEKSGAPVKPKKVNRIQGESFNSTDSFNFLELCEQGALEYTDDYQFMSERKLTEMTTTTINVKPMLGESQQQSTRSFHVHKTAERSSSHQSDANSTDSSFESRELHDGDTFRAFTETVEALALQKSVIGNSHVVPASSEEIERAIAEAQAKIKQQQQVKIDTRQDVDVVQPISTSDNKSNTAVERVWKTPVTTELSSGTVADSEVSRSRLAENEAVRSTGEENGISSEHTSNEKLDGISGSEGQLDAGIAATTNADGSVVISPLSSSSSQTGNGVRTSTPAKTSPELIRVSAEKVVTSSTPRSSWFWSSKPTVTAANVRSAAPSSAEAQKKPNSRKGKNSEKTDSSSSRIDARRGDPMTDGDVVQNVDNGNGIGGQNQLSGVAEGVVAGSVSTPAAASRQRESVELDAVEHSTGTFTNDPSHGSVLPQTAAAELSNSVTSTSAEVSNQKRRIASPAAKPLTSETPSGAGRTKTVSSSTSASRQSSMVGSQHDEEGLIERLLLEKAGLEGRLEVLEQENRRMLKEQSELKARAAAAEEHIKASSAAGQGLTVDRNALAADLETLRLNRGRLEAVIIDAHKLIEEKDQEVKTLERDLELARQAGEKHLERVSEGRRLVTARDTTIRDLKTKITELYVQSQTNEHTRLASETELAAVRSELAAATEAKEWYANQLRAAQRDRNKLQSETAAAKAETIAAGVASERLRAENARIKRNLTEVEQRVLVEKQKLARHLEEIEQDMLEREAAFAAAAQLKQTAQVEKTASSAEGTDLTDSGRDEADLLRIELGKLREQAEAQRLENVDLTRRLTLSQQSIVERDDTIKKLERDREAAEIRAETAEQDVSLRAKTLQQMEASQSELQAQLEAAAEEKKMIDQSLQTLKRNTVVLETGFRKMQQDLLAKSQELEKMKLAQVAESSALALQLQEVSDIETAAGIHRSSAVAAVRVEEKKTEKDAAELAREAAAPNAAEPTVAPPPPSRVTVSVEVQTDVDVVVVGASPSTTAATKVVQLSSSTLASSDRADPVVFQEPVPGVQVVEYGVTETSGATFESSEHEFARSEILRLKKLYSEQHHRAQELQNLLACAEEKLVSVQTERNSSAEQLQKLRMENLAAGSSIASLTERLAALEMKHEQMAEEKCQLEKMLEETNCNALAIHTSAMNSASAEKTELRTKLEELQRDSQKDITKLKSKILKLNKQLESSAAEHGKEVLQFELQLRELAEQVSSANESKSKLESQIVEIQQRALLDADERTAKLQDDLQKVSADHETAIAARTQLEQQLATVEAEHREMIEENHRRTAILEAELQTLRSSVEQQQETDELAKNLALELEKERGRLAGVLQSHATLKEHAEALEAQLAELASTDVRSDASVRDEMDKRDRALADATSRIEQVEMELAKEKQSLKDLRAQLLTEKGNHIKTRRQLEQLTAEHNQLAADTAEVNSSFSKLTSDNELTAARELEFKMAADRAAADLKAAMAERDRLARELEDQRARDAALQDNIQGLEWRLNEKDSEIAASNEKLKLVEERQATELASLTESLKANAAELSAIHNELALVKKDRSALQVRVIQLQSALKKALATKVDLSLKTETSEELERLVQDTAPSAMNSKPLSFLQATLSGLRGEISCLQTQITEHTTAVQSSSMAWRELEAQVQDLREVCKTSAADRAAATNRSAPNMKRPHSITPRTSTISLPTSGPLVLPGNRVTVTTAGDTVTSSLPKAEKSERAEANAEK